jgi:hypothetical protein
MNQNNNTDERIIHRNQLVADALRAVYTLVPSETVPAPESLVLYLYELKKKIIEIDPNWKFMSPYNDYIFRTLILLDALDVSESLDLEMRKICQLICRETRDIKRFNPQWKFKVEEIINFLNSTS